MVEKEESKDPRYKHAWSVWAVGELKSFREIFDIVPKSTVARDLGLNYGRFAKRINRPGMLTYREAYKMAKLIGIEFMALSSLITRDVQEQMTNNSRENKISGEGINRK
jgi:hypothetical protein